MELVFNTLVFVNIHFFYFLKQDVSNVRMCTLLEKKEIEVAELRSSANRISATAQRWAQSTSLSSVAADQPTEQGKDMLQGMPSSLIEFLTQIASSSSSPSKTSLSSSMLHQTTLTTSSSSSSLSPSTPQAARALLSQWVNASGGSTTSSEGNNSEGSLSPGSLAGTPRMMENSSGLSMSSLTLSKNGSTASSFIPGTPSSTFSSSYLNVAKRGTPKASPGAAEAGTPGTSGRRRSLGSPFTNSTSVSAMLHQEAHASKLALRLSRLEEQNRMLVDKRTEIEHQFNLDIVQLNKELTTKTKSLQEVNKKFQVLENTNIQIERKRKDTTLSLERCKQTTLLATTRSKEEIHTLERNITDLRLQCRRKEEELEKTKEILTSTKMESRSTVSH